MYNYRYRNKTRSILSLDIELRDLVVAALTYAAIAHFGL